MVFEKLFESHLSMVYLKVVINIGKGVCYYMDGHRYKGKFNRILDE